MITSYGVAAYRTDQLNDMSPVTCGVRRVQWIWTRHAHTREPHFNAHCKKGSKPGRRYEQAALRSAGSADICAGPRRCAVVVSRVSLDGTLRAN